MVTRISLTDADGLSAAPVVGVSAKSLAAALDSIFNAPAQSAFGPNICCRKPNAT
jgi:hypothetical protein